MVSRNGTGSCAVEEPYVLGQECGCGDLWTPASSSNDDGVHDELLCGVILASVTCGLSPFVLSVVPYPAYQFWDLSSILLLNESLFKSPIVSSYELQLRALTHKAINLHFNTFHSVKPSVSKPVSPRPRGRNEWGKNEWHSPHHPRTEMSSGKTTHT